MLWTYGGDVFDANGQPALNSSQNIAAVTMYADLARSGIVETQRQLDAMFLQGQTGFWNSGSWMLSKLAATTKLRYAIVPMPGIDGRPGVSFAGGEYLAISKKAGNRDLARKLVAFLTHGEQSIRFCSQVAEAGFPADKNFVSHESLTRDPLRAAFAQQLQSARMTPVHPKWLDIEEVLEDAVVRVIYGERSPKQALDEAQQEVRRIVNAP
jgi:maltose-binding protein MalE